MRKFNEWVSKKETSINRELFQKHFKFQRPSDMLKALYTTNDKKKNNDLVDVINSRLSDLRKKIEDLSEEEKKFVPKLEFAEVGLVHCNLVNNNYQ